MCRWWKSPDSKVRGANMGPSGANRTQEGPMLAPWTLLSGRADTCTGQTKSLAHLILSFRRPPKIMQISRIHNFYMYFAQTSKTLQLFGKSGNLTRQATNKQIVILASRRNAEEPERLPPLQHYSHARNVFPNIVYSSYLCMWTLGF